MLGGIDAIGEIDNLATLLINLLCQNKLFCKKKVTFCDLREIPTPRPSVFGNENKLCVKTKIVFKVKQPPRQVHTSKTTVCKLQNEQLGQLFGYCKMHSYAKFLCTVKYAAVPIIFLFICHIYPPFTRKRCIAMFWTISPHSLGRKLSFAYCKIHS